jgi:hypothetical protein
MDRRYVGPVVRIARVAIDPSKANQRLPLSDRIGETSMLLNGRQLGLINRVNGLSGTLYLYLKGYLQLVPNGTRYFPFVFPNQTVVITYEKGKDARLLSLGSDSRFSEAYDLTFRTCNPSTVRHCFQRFPNSLSNGLELYLPIFQPNEKLSDGYNDWSIPRINLI